MMNKELRNDVVEWDTANWGRAIDFWKIPQDLHGKKVLDIGGRNGGLSLLFALHGADVVCSDINTNGFEKAKLMHQKYGVSEHVTYEEIDVTTLDATNEYDIITYKSVWGGVGYDNHFERQELMIQNIHRALKTGGVLYFAENLTGSRLHAFLRKHFIPWGNRWRYMTVGEVKTLTAHFSSFSYHTFGFLGVLGRNKFLSNIFGHIDFAFDRFLPEQTRYIISAVCKK